MGPGGPASSHSSCGPRGRPGPASAPRTLCGWGGEGWGAENPKELKPEGLGTGAPPQHVKSRLMKASPLGHPPNSVLFWMDQTPPRTAPSFSEQYPCLNGEALARRRACPRLANGAPLPPRASQDEQPPPERPRPPTLME